MSVDAKARQAAGASAASRKLLLPLVLSLTSTPLLTASHALRAYDHPRRPRESPLDDIRCINAIVRTNGGRDGRLQLCRRPGTAEAE